VGDDEGHVLLLGEDEVDRGAVEILGGEPFELLEVGRESLAHGSSSSVR
jgi:hypothetical protein